MHPSLGMKKAIVLWCKNAVALGITLINAGFEGGNKKEKN